MIKRTDEQISTPDGGVASEVYHPSHGSNRRGTVYQRGVALFLATAIMSVIGAVLDIGFETHLVAIGGSSLLLAILTYILSTGESVRTDVVEAVYDTQAVQATRAFGGPERNHEYYRHDSGEVELVVSKDRSEQRLRPTQGDVLLEKFGFDPPQDTDTQETVFYLMEVLTDDLEILDRGTLVSVEEHSVTVSVHKSPFGPVDRVDHPIKSVLATGLVYALNRPVVVRRPRGTDESNGGELLHFSWHD